MFCPQCGAQINPEAKFCKHCGTPLANSRPHAASPAVVVEAGAPATPLEAAPSPASTPPPTIHASAPTPLTEPSDRTKASSARQPAVPRRSLTSAVPAPHTRKRIYVGLTIAAIMIAVAGASAFHTYRSHRVALDANIFENVKAKLFDDASLRKCAIDVTAHDGIVTLVGQVNTDDDKERAVVIAKQQQGVKQVVSQLALPGEPTPDTPQVIFFDDFTGSSLDGTKWLAMNEFGRSGNREQQCYVPSEDVLTAGYLEIVTAHRSVTCGTQNTASTYASGEVESIATFTYGTLEYRAEMPGGQGAWPAVWLLGHNCQPTSPNGTYSSACHWPGAGSDEIDVTEIMNDKVTLINQQVHSAWGNPGCKAKGVADVTENFHVYNLVWSPGSIIWKVDGKVTCKVTGSAIPSQGMFLILNTAVGGIGGGTAIDGSSMPWKMRVQYVKISQP